MSFARPWHRAGSAAPTSAFCAGDRHGTAGALWTRLLLEAKSKAGGAGSAGTALEQTRVQVERSGTEPNRATRQPRIHTLPHAQLASDKDDRKTEACIAGPAASGVKEWLAVWLPGPAPEATVRNLPVASAGLKRAADDRWGIIQGSTAQLTLPQSAAWRISSRRRPGSRRATF